MFPPSFAALPATTRRRCNHNHNNHSSAVSPTVSSSSSFIRRPPLRSVRHVRPHFCISLVSASASAKEGPNDGNDAGSDAGTDMGQRKITRKPSGTMLGRILVEIMALIAGFTVLFVVAIWKALNILAGYIWKLFRWISNVRMLGHWAFVRAQALFLGVANSPGTRISAFAAILAAKFSSAIAAMKSRFQNMNARDVPVKSANVTDDDIDGNRNTQRIQQGTSKERQPNVRPAPRSPPGPRLILLRHGKSLWDIAGPDHERSLSTAGEAEARRVGRELFLRGWHYDSVLCSNSRRTVQTLSLLSDTDSDSSSSENGLQVPDVKTKMTESLYFAVSADEMADVVDDEAAPGDCRLIVAHSPGIDELVERLTGTKPEMGTACAALLEYSYNDNADAEGGGVTLKDAMHAWNLVDIVCPGPVEK